MITLQNTGAKIREYIELTKQMKVNDRISYFCWKKI